MEAAMSEQKQTALPPLEAGAREVVATLRGEGWTFVRCGKGGHLILRHPSGAQTVVPSRVSRRTFRAADAYLAEARRAVRRQEIAADA
jgi:predicted RNA binding protein YcfA (HicA-like mRNA interferase family)